jgi:hypothetical protein
MGRFYSDAAAVDADLVRALLLIALPEESTC